jgi:hypothetical protein
LLDLFQEKGREIMRPGNPDAGGKAGQQPLLAPALTERGSAGTGGKGIGKGARGPARRRCLAITYPSSHLLARIPKAKTMAAKTPIIAA